MSKIFYIGEDDKVYGPYTEQEVQAWYASGYLSSDVKFQISVTDRFDPKERLLTLGELIDLNGRSLPFYFSTENTNREKEQEERLSELNESHSDLLQMMNALSNKKETDRVKEHEKTLKQLKQEVEALRSSLKDQHRNQNEKVSVLDSRIASLAKSNDDLLQKVNAITNKKESSPEIPQLEKKMVEIKKKVEEQEKSLTSTKKEISAVNSKCDRNDSKLEKLIEKQNEMEGYVNGYDDQISALKSSELSIRDSIASCEQNAESTSNQLQLIANDLSEVQKVIKELRNESVEHGVSIGSMTKDVTELIAKTQIKSYGPPQELSSEPVQENDSLPPWDRQKDKKGFTYEAEDHDAPLPWNKNKQSGGGAQESADANKADNKVVVEQKNSKHEATSVKTEVKSVSRTKNWDAICRELSSDDEEKEEAHDEKVLYYDAENETITLKKPEGNAKESSKIIEIVPENSNQVPKATSPGNALLDKIMNSRPTVPRKNHELIKEFMQLFRQYLTFLRTKKMNQMHTLRIKALDGISLELMEWKSDSPEFIPLAQALITDITKVCAEEQLVCWYCPCRMFTPVNLLDHLIEQVHIDRMMIEGDVARLHAETVQRMLGKLSCLLKRTGPRKREDPLMEKGEPLYMKLLGSEKLRPTRDFVRTKLQEYMNLVCAGDARAIMLANVGGELNPTNDEYLMRVIRKWFGVEENRKRFLKEYEEHISTGVPHCSTCKMAFTSKDDFYKHVTGYVHARLNHLMFEGVFVRLARGSQDWDITM